MAETKKPGPETASKVPPAARPIEPKAPELKAAQLKVPDAKISDAKISDAKALEMKALETKATAAKAAAAKATGAKAAAAKPPIAKPTIDPVAKTPAAKTAKPAGKVASASKTTPPPRAASAPKARPQTATITKAAKSTVAPIPAQPVPAPQAAELKAAAGQAGETLRRAFADATSASTQGAFLVNDKMLAAFRAQSDATFDLWRSTLSAPSVSEALRAQTGGVRQVYETTTAHWQDVAETTKTWLDDSVRPLRSIWADRFR